MRLMENDLALDYAYTFIPREDRIATAWLSSVIPNSETVRLGTSLETFHNTSTYRDPVISVMFCENYSHQHHFLNDTIF